VYLWSYPRAFFARDPWVQRAPGIPHALCFQGGRLTHSSGASRREIAELCLHVFARSDSDEAIHSFFPVARWIASLALAMTVTGLIAAWLFDNRIGASGER
jgi:hypothetical protein